MTELGPGDYAAAFAVSLALSWMLTPLMLRLALRTQAVDAPDEARKAQTSAVPYLGGVAIVCGFSAAVLAAAFVQGPVNGVDSLIVILGLALGLAIMGLVDDLWGLSPYVRIAAEVGAGAAVYASGLGIRSFGPPGVDLTVTILWILIVTNALNLLDNMDGLSAGTATIASVGFCAIAAVNGQFLIAALSAALAGCALGFLRHNFYPARIYMGDAGSLFLGFLLAVIGIGLRPEEAPLPVAVFVPVLVLGVALFDTTLVTVNRLRHHISPLVGGRDHTSHRLVYIGVPVPVAVGLIYLVGLSLAWLALILSRLDDATSGYMLVAFALSLGAVLFALLSAVPVYETSRQKASMIRLVRSYEVEPPPVLGAPRGEAAS